MRLRDRADGLSTARAGPRIGPLGLPSPRQSTHMTLLPPIDAAGAASPPAWRLDAWLNATTPPALDALRGRVVVVLAFQMLCPGCVAHALPLAARVHRLFPREDLAMIGLHTVFEHHAAMTPTALAAFVHEYRLPFPIGVDRADGAGPLPATMRAYAMRGTPTWLLYDRAGRLRRHWFGEIDPLLLGAQIGALLDRPQPDANDQDAAHPHMQDPDADSPPPADPACDADACAVREK